MTNTDELIGQRRFIVQEIAHMVAKGMKSGVFEDWTIANKIADRVEKDQERIALEVRIDELERRDIEGWHYLKPTESKGMYFGEETTITSRQSENVSDRLAELKSQLQELEGERNE